MAAEIEIRARIVESNETCARMRMDGYAEVKTLVAPYAIGSVRCRGIGQVMIVKAVDLLAGHRKVSSKSIKIYNKRRLTDVRTEQNSSSEEQRSESKLDLKYITRSQKSRAQMRFSPFAGGSWDGQNQIAN
ncbi:hypothetical protein EVAR_45718_1 [Eumeta japonica]|uniref:Uncharacterized protein n=1 Tax=Eumeta variegata TaxID=151549 RepID=A0A4C1WV33_EUMVA|nr:hypothetical protein EVAR_45718_1 [Eumeta japonica]